MIDNIEVLNNTTIKIIIIIIIRIRISTTTYTRSNNPSLSGSKAIPPNNINP